jgi:hypothetical protein
LWFDDLEGLALLKPTLLLLKVTMGSVVVLWCGDGVVVRWWCCGAVVVWGCGGGVVVWCGVGVCLCGVGVVLV